MKRGCVGGKRGFVGMWDCNPLRPSNYPMGRWFLLMRWLTFCCNLIPCNPMWCVWLTSATALRGQAPPGYCFLPHGIMGIVYLALSAPFCQSLLPLFILPPLSSFPCLLSPSIPLVLSPCVSDGIIFQLEEDVLIFFTSETKPLYVDSWGVTVNQPFSLLTLNC